MHRVLAGGWNGPEGGLRKDSPDSSGGSCSATEFAECLVAASAEPCYEAYRFPVLLQIGLLLNFRGLRGVFRASGRGAGHDSLPGCFLSPNASVRFAVHF